MRILLLMVLLAGAPFMAAETEPPSDTGGPEKATGPLTPLEVSLQGTWKPNYTIIIEGREFCADTQPGEWYEGYIVIRPDEEPAQFDFVIEECACGFKGETSEGIVRLDGETVVIVSPPPGKPRPREFEATEQLVLMRFEPGGESQDPAEHCSTWVAPATLNSSR